MQKFTFLALSLGLMSCGSLETPIQTLVLFQGQSQYEEKPETEVNIQGVLNFNPNPAQSPSERTSRYSLDVSGKFYYFYDFKNKENELSTFVGKSIYIKGKIIDIHINDLSWPNEIWPAIISVNAKDI